MADDPAFPVFIDESNVENLVTCTVKAETPTELVLHGADKAQPRIEKRKFHTRKLILSTILTKQVTVT